jgi:hypothetical protein
MLRANADASGHQIFAAEEDIILRELEVRRHAPLSPVACAHVMHSLQPTTR